jgi:hypothetical protein
MTRTLLFFSLMLVTASVAIASPCTDEIARLDARISARLGVLAQSGPSEPESVGARLHHQPTPGSIASAEGRAGVPAQDALKRLMAAREADRLGDQTACEQAAAEAGRLLGQ